MWFKNRRAKCRQQLQHQTSASVNSSKSTTGNNSSSASSRNNSSNNNNSSSTASSKNSSSGSTNSSSNNKTSNNSSSNPLKSSSHHHSGTNSSNNNNSSSATNNNTSTNNNAGTPNGHGISSQHQQQQQHNPSPILPMTPSTSVSPPINVICKKEITSFHSHHNTSNGSVNDSSLKSSAYDSLKSDAELSGLSHHPSAYANINSRLGQGTGTGNLTPLGSNSSIMTTPSPPITPQNHNPLSYVPNHEHNFWYNQYNQYPSNYNASYYTQMDYFQNQSQSNYNMGHTGYSTSNFGLNSGSSLGGAMSAQAFSPNLDYMPQDKYVNMV